jgi:hypothetical protein
MIFASLNRIEPDMRALKFGLTLMLVAGVLEAAGAEPVTIRAAWIAPATNWASILLEKKDLATHLARPMCCSRSVMPARRRW